MKKKLIVISVLLFCAFSSKAQNSISDEEMYLSLSTKLWRLRECYFDSIKLDEPYIMKHEYILLLDTAMVLAKSDTIRYWFKTSNVSSNELKLTNFLESTNVFNYEIVHKNKYALILKHKFTDELGKNHFLEYRYFNDPKLLFNSFLNVPDLSTLN